MQIKINGKWVNDNTYTNSKNNPNLSSSWSYSPEEKQRIDKIYEEHEKIMKQLNKGYYK